MKDLANPKWMYVKAAIFVFIGVVCVAILFLDQPTLRTAVLLALAIWAFCRAYYFAFYVIEHYVDPDFQFSGLGSFVRYVVTRNRQ